MAAERAVCRKYMAGQAVLAVDVRNQTWMRKSVDELLTENEEEVPDKLLRILRVSAGSRVTMQIMFTVDINWKLIHQEEPPTSENHVNMCKEMAYLLKLAEEFGFGKVHHDCDRVPYLHKYLYRSLTMEAKKRLQKYRIPSWKASSWPLDSAPKKGFCQ